VTWLSGGGSVEILGDGCSTEILFFAANKNLARCGVTLDTRDEILTSTFYDRQVMFPNLD
jgi:hypothetical protein